MLGDGRPFIIELVNPKKKISLNNEVVKKIEVEINKSSIVGVRGLHVGENNLFNSLKESESQKIKMYCCLVVTSSPLSKEAQEELNALSDVILKQKTPLRVLHRRTLMVRDKVIHKLKVKEINQNSYVVFVLASAGTYIKEFIHGDLKRTMPNFATLAKIHKSDIIQLDVLNIFKTLNEDSLKRFEELCDEYYQEIQ